MLRMHLARWLLVVACLGGCAGHGGAGREPDEYTGCASDENWATLDDAAPRTVLGGATAPVFSSPTEGSTLPFADQPVFAWSPSAGTAGAPDGDVPHENGPGCTDCCPQFNLGALTTLHLPAISGNLYDLQLRVEGEIVHRVITTLQRWTPPDPLWQALRGKTVALELRRLSLLRNDAKEGPFAPPLPLSFSVGG